MFLALISTGKECVQGSKACYNYWTEKESVTLSRIAQLHTVCFPHPPQHVMEKVTQFHSFATNPRIYRSVFPRISGGHAASIRERRVYPEIKLTRAIYSSRSVVYLVAMIENKLSSHSITQTAMLLFVHRHHDD